MIDQGRLANKSGATAEHVIACILSDIPHRRQVILGQSIYGHPLRIDIVIDLIAAYPQGLAIEIKRQNSSGSVDEKIPYAIANIKEALPMPGVLILDGAGMKRGARRWAEKQVGGNLVAVLDAIGFAGWIQNKL